MFAKDLRKSQQKANSPCCICGKHRLITQWHHVYPLEECVELLENGHDSVTSPLISLCPNCHAYVHTWLKWLKKGKYQNMLGVMREERIYNSISQQEFQEITRIAKQGLEVKNGL